MLIYVAGPYSAPSAAERQYHVEAAMNVGLALLQRGHAPVIPHLTHFFASYIRRMHGESLPYETYMAWDAELLYCCDALFLIASSPGADREVAAAERLGLSVFRAIDDIPVNA